MTEAPAPVIASEAKQSRATASGPWIATLPPVARDDVSK